jgi:hypothetical protein
MVTRKDDSFADGALEGELFDTVGMCVCVCVCALGECPKLVSMFVGFVGSNKFDDGQERRPEIFGGEKDIICRWLSLAA